MKYMIMTFGDASSLATRSREWVEEMISFMKRIDVELAQSGELVFQQGLTDSATAKTVTVDNGEPVVTDGPLSNAMEALQGFWVVDVENEGRSRHRRADQRSGRHKNRGARVRGRAAGRRCGDPRLTTSTLAFGRNSRERDVSQLDP